MFASLLKDAASIFEPVQKNPALIFGFLICALLLAVFSAVTVYSPMLALVITVSLIFCAFIIFNPLAGIVLSMLAAFTNHTIVVYLFTERTTFSVLPILLIYSLLSIKLFKTVYKAERSERVVFILILFFVAWTGISLFWTHNYNQGVNDFLTLMSSVLMVQMFLVFINDRETLFKVLSIFSLLGLGLGILLVTSKWYSGSETISILSDLKIKLSIIKDAKRPGGFAPPNLASLVINIFIFANMALLYRGGFLMKAFRVLVILFLISSHLIVSSKAGLLNMVMGLAIFIFTVPQLRNWRIRIATAFTVLVGFAVAVAGNVLINRFILLFEKGVGTKGDRLGWWATGFGKLYESGGIGTGVGGFMQYILPAAGPHSLYFSILFDLGIIGILLFFLLIILTINHIVLALRKTKDNELIYVTYCFNTALIITGWHGVIDGDYQQQFFWVLLAIVIAIAKITALSGGETPQNTPSKRNKAYHRSVWNQ
ncbi:MAG: hypothetical protein HY954_12385 [Deltaproteobacteria bacterium]|nr:hypothetical protein [Deltaproteobacteria bacterium]